MERMLDEPGIAMIDKAIGELPNNAGDLFDLAEQQSAAVGADSPAIKTGGDFSSIEAWKFEGRWCTLCHRRSFLFVARKVW